MRKILDILDEPVVATFFVLLVAILIVVGLEYYFGSNQENYQEVQDCMNQIKGDYTYLLAMQCYDENKNLSDEDYLKCVKDKKLNTSLKSYCENKINSS